MPPASEIENSMSYREALHAWRLKNRVELEAYRNVIKRQKPFTCNEAGRLAAIEKLLENF